MRPRLVINPPSDAAFVAFAKLSLDDAVTSTEELERRLHSRYPRAVVHARQLADEPVVVWYVYRDGRWVPASLGGGVDLGGAWHD